MIIHREITYDFYPDLKSTICCNCREKIKYGNSCIICEDENDPHKKVLCRKRIAVFCSVECAEKSWGIKLYNMRREDRLRSDCVYCGGTGYRHNVCKECEGESCDNCDWFGYVEIECPRCNQLW